MHTILYLLKTGASGSGVLSAIQEGLGLELLSCKVYFLIEDDEFENYLSQYQWLGLNRDHLIGYSTDENLLRDIDGLNVNICIATVFHTAKLARLVANSRSDIAACYYVQDYEPNFFNEVDNAYSEAIDSYKLGLNCFCKTKFLAATLAEKHGINSYLLVPSISDIFNAKNRRIHDRVRIVGMFRPESKVRGAKCLLNVFEKLHSVYGDLVELVIFGGHSYSSSLLPHYIKNMGNLSSIEVSILFKNSDIFVDTSLYQGFGRTGLEAMLSGCVPVLPIGSGPEIYAINNINAILTIPNNSDLIFESVTKLIDDKPLWETLSRNGIVSGSNFSIYNSCCSLLKFFESVNPNLKTQKYTSIDKWKLLIKPKMMENGLPTGSGYLRLVIPYSDLKSEKFDIHLDFEMALPKISDLQNSCCVYLQRDGISNNLDDFERWAQIWKYAGNKIFYDIDDNLFDCDQLAIRVGSYDNAISIANKAKIICKYADLITVSTTELYKILKGYSDNVIVIPNTISKLHWDVEGPIVKNSSPSILTIGYVGTPTHDKDLELVHQSVRKIMEDYAGKVVFEVIGAYQNIIPPIGKKIWLPDKSEYPVFVEWLQKVQNWDIGIIPLVDDSFNQSKSNLKFLEYAAMGIPIICSDVPSYRNIAKNMDNCIVVNNTELSWYNALKLLIDDFYLRKKIADKARASLLDDYITEDLADNFLELLAAGTLDD